MDTLLEVKEGIIKQFMRYRKADKTPDFRKRLINELSRITEQQRQDVDFCTELLEHHLSKFEARLAAEELIKAQVIIEEED